MFFQSQQECNFNSAILFGFGSIITYFINPISTRREGREDSYFPYVILIIFEILILLCCLPLGGCLYIACD